MRATKLAVSGIAMGVTFALAVSLGAIAPASGSEHAKADTEWWDDASPTSEPDLLQSEDPELSLPVYAAGEESATQLHTADDATLSETRASTDEPRVEILAARASDSRTFELSDGSREVELYGERRLFEDETGAWQLIDTEVSPEDRESALQSDGNAWTTRFESIAPTAPAGGVSFEHADHAITIEPVTDASIDPEKDSSAGSTVHYEQVWDDTDLSYTVEPSGLDQSVLIRSADASHQFEWHVEGAVPAPHDGGLKLSSESPLTVLISPPSIVTAAGEDVTSESGARIESDDSGQGFTASLNPEWLASQDTGVFPLTASPRITVVLDGVNDAVETVNYGPNGTTYTDGDRVRIGRNSTGSWRSQIHFNYEPLLSQNSGTTYRVIAASMALHRHDADLNTPANGQATPYIATSESWSGTIGQAIDNGLDGPPTRYENGLKVMSWADGGYETWLSRQFDEIFDAGTEGVRVGFRGDEAVSGTLHDYWPTLTLRLVSPPPTTVLTSPANTVQLTTRTPTFEATPVTGAAEQVFYRFEATTQRGAGAAARVSSGWITGTSWTVPDASLEDGATYFARVYTAYDITNPDQPATKLYTRPQNPDPMLDREFKVNLGLGSGGPSPVEDAGEVSGTTEPAGDGIPLPYGRQSTVKVNMVNGNLAVALPMQEIKTFDGEIAPELVYNSRGTSTSGLVGEYFVDPSSTGSFTGNGVALRAHRTDSQIDFDWLRGVTPVESISSGSFLARWTGYISVPQSGSWRFGTSLTDWSPGGLGGVRVYLGNDTEPAVDRWTNSTQTQWEIASLSSARTVTAGQKLAIRIEVRGVAGDLAVKLVAARDSQLHAAQPSWLSQRNPILPDGWHLSAGGGPVSYAGLSDLGDQVLIHAADGSSTSYRRVSTGGYQPPEGGTDHLSVDERGRFVLSTGGGGLTYIYRPDGRVESIESSINNTQPRSLRFRYTTDSEPRLLGISDPVSGRGVTFQYAPSLEDCDQATDGQLCAISFSDGRTTVLQYAGGRLVRTRESGPNPNILPSWTDFRYDGTGALAGIRDKAASDLLSFSEAGSDLNALLTQISYDSEGRVASVVKPAPVPGANRPTATYHYFPQEKRTGMKIVGFSARSGFARQVRYDERARIITDTDATGTVTAAYQWDSDNRLIAIEDGEGLRTVHDHDSMGRRVATWGPAPKVDFGSDGRPIPSANVPHATLEYDGGISGLAAVYWANSSFAGSPAMHGTGLQSSTLNRVWASPPVAVAADGRWSLRLTGSIAFPAQGAYTISGANSSGNVRIWVEDKLVFERWGGRTLPAQTVSALAPGERQRVRIEYGALVSPHRLTVNWQGPGVTGSPAVPESALKPELGLVTSSVDADGKVEATEYSDASRGIGPHHRQPTATVLDPGGLALRTTHSYEDPRLGGFLRQTGRTLPAGNTWSTLHYGAAEGPIEAACGVTTATRQGGSIRERTGPDPSGSDAARVEQFIYDPSGREVGRRTGSATTINAADWECTEFDSRGRMIRHSWPARDGHDAREVEYGYSAALGRLSTIVAEGDESEKTVAAAFDLAGRVSMYTAGGFTTSTEYDRLGRVTSRVGPQGTVTNQYVADSGRLSSVSLDGMLVASILYQPNSGRISTVFYGNGTSYWPHWDRYGRQDRITFDGNGDYPVLESAVTYSSAGRMIDETFWRGYEGVDPTPGTPGMTYDAAGRLISWAGPAGSETYGYGLSPCGSSALAGKNTNLVSTTTSSGTNRTYCYDQADRVVVGGSVASVSYDDRGNTVELNGQHYSYDAAGRVVRIRDGSISVSYARDAVGRIMDRVDGTSTTRQGYSGPNEDVSFVANAQGVVQKRFIVLPGGARLTSPSMGSRTWTYPDVHGNAAVVTNAQGWATESPVTLSPWGEGQPPATDGSMTPGFLATDGKLTETIAGLDATVQLGARTYLPSMGRFLSVDPIVGGCANDYVYVKGDPLNQKDPTGLSCWRDTLGDILGGIGLLAGLAALPLSGGASLALGIIGFLAGAGSAVLNMDSCVNRGSATSCAGAGLDGIGLLIGGIGMLIGKTAGMIADVVSLGLGLGTAAAGITTAGPGGGGGGRSRGGKPASGSC